MHLHDQHLDRQAATYVERLHREADRARILTAVHRPSALRLGFASALRSLADLLERTPRAATS
jgi:hypothetical protein